MRESKKKKMEKMFTVKPGFLNEEGTAIADQVISKK